MKTGKKGTVAADTSAEWLQRAVESLLEDERLRSHLTDDEADVLLAWGQKQVELAAQTVSAAGEEASQENLDAVLRRIRSAMREINDLTGEKDSLSDKEMKQRLEALLYEGESRKPLSILADQVGDLVSQRKNLSNREFVERLTSLAFFAPQVEQTRPGAGVKEAAAPEKPPAPPTRGFPSRSVLLAAGVIAIALCLLLALAVLLFPRPSPEEPAVSVTATGGWYQVYFTTPKYPDNRADHKGSLDEKLAAFINTAQTSVDMAIYQLDLRNVIQALLEAKKRGCTVRVVTDIDILNDPKENPSFKQLQAAGITVVAGNSNGIMHNKFVVVDNKAVWTGSWNFTEYDTYRYNNNGILIQSPELARNYAITFEKMWRDKKFGADREPGGTTPQLTIPALVSAAGTGTSGVAVENYFAPEDGVAAKIARRLQMAQKTLDFLAFSFTDDNLGEAVRTLAASGVKVRGVFEKTGSETKYSEYGRFKAAGLDVLQDGNPYLMHHKVFIIDGQTVIFGSFNFSRNADESNDENVLIIDEAGLASQFTAEFERVYAQAKNPPKK